MGEQSERTLNDLIFVGLNGRVLALDRYSGELAWAWKAPRRTGFVTIFLDGDRLIAAFNGYLYCLDPLFGQEVWSNPLKGYGTGITSLASVNGATGSIAGAEITRQQAQAAAASTVPAVP